MQPQHQTIFSHFFIDDKVESVNGDWTDGKIIGYAQDYYFYVYVDNDVRRCHFNEIKQIQPKQSVSEQPIQPSSWSEIVKTIDETDPKWDEFNRIENCQEDLSEAANAFAKLNFLLSYSYSSDTELQEDKMKRFLTYYENRLLLMRIYNYKL